MLQFWVVLLSDGRRKKFLGLLPCALLCIFQRYDYQMHLYSIYIFIVLPACL